MEEEKQEGGVRMQLIREHSTLGVGDSLENTWQEALRAGKGPQNSEEQQERTDGGVTRAMMLPAFKEHTLFFLLTDPFLLIDLDTCLRLCFHLTWVCARSTRVQNAVLGCNFKNNKMISVCFQGKPFNITVIQDYAPPSNAEEAEVEWFCEDLQDLL